MGLSHDRKRRVLAGADDQPRPEGPARNRQERVSHEFTTVLASADEIDDLYPIAVPHDRVRKELTPEDAQVVLDGDSAGVDLQFREQIRHGDWGFDSIGIPVERDEQIGLVGLHHPCQR